MHNKINKGFTLIELLVVISIIGVLVGVLLTNFVGVRERAADTKRKSDLIQLKKALRLYYNDYQGYPIDNGFFDEAGGTFRDANTVYMKVVPEYKVYDASPSGENFILYVTLENTSDSDIQDSESRCRTTMDLVGIDSTEYDAVTDFIVCED